jgi:hypothetical protein
MGKQATATVATTTKIKTIANQPLLLHFRLASKGAIPIDAPKYAYDVSIIVNISIITVPLRLCQ